MKRVICKLTERGQVSFPASFRKSMGIQPGQKLSWEMISETEVRVAVEPPVQPDPAKALGFGCRLRKTPGRRTATWMRELRDDV